MTERLKISKKRLITYTFLNTFHLINGLKGRYNGKLASTGPVCFERYPGKVFLYRASTGFVQRNVPKN